MTSTLTNPPTTAAPHFFLPSPPPALETTCIQPCKDTEKTDTQAHTHKCRAHTHIRFFRLAPRHYNAPKVDTLPCPDERTPPPRVEGLAREPCGSVRSVLPVYASWDRCGYRSRSLSPPLTSCHLTARNSPGHQGTWTAGHNTNPHSLFSSHHAAVGALLCDTCRDSAPLHSSHLH